jgi:hypothetical protein
MLQLKQSISIEKFFLNDRVFLNAFQFSEFVLYKDTLVLDKNEIVNTSDIQTVLNNKRIIFFILVFDFDFFLFTSTFN